MKLTGDPVLAIGVEKHSSNAVELRWRAFEYRLEFESREFTEQPNGSTLYYEDDGDICNVPCYEFTHANRFVDGIVKWDGCSTVGFGPEADGGDMHLCGPSEFEKVQWVLMEVVRLARAHVPQYAIEAE